MQWKEAEKTVTSLTKCSDEKTRFEIARKSEMDTEIERIRESLLTPRRERQLRIRNNFQGSKP